MAYLTVSDLHPGHLVNFRRYVAVGGPDECWEWSGPRDRYGYSSSRVRDGRLQQGTGGHRVAYLMLRGSIAPGEVLDHLCRNRACVNPNHLEAVSDRENILRGAGVCATYARKTHCKHGHEFTPENTYRRANGGRACRACKLARSAARRG